MTRECLSEDAVLAFAGGRLSSLQRESAHAHLDECEDCQQLLSEAVRALANAATADGLVEHDEATWSATFRPGALVGQRYAIRRFVARGGMGEVYEALDQELHERVALKTVNSTASDDPNAARRLKAEVQLARRVSHPNVCRIYDFGVHIANGSGAEVSFLTMEFVEGETLGQRIRRQGALPIAEANAIARQLLSGLAAAHAAGVLHRDFKSDNVMLRSDGHGVSPLILDFGLARSVGPRLPTNHSSHRGLVGTFAYIAPEQLEGKPNTTASDIYSFGVVWFEMLTGELPFTTRPAAGATALDRLLRAAPAPSQLNPHVPRYLDSLLLGCLTRSPRERFETAAAVLARFEQLQRQGPTLRRTFIPLTAAVGLFGAAAYLALDARDATSAKAAAPAIIATQRAAIAAIATEPAPAASPAAPAPPQPVVVVDPAASAPRRSSPRRVDGRTDGVDAAPRASTATATEPPAPPATTHLADGWENPFRSD